VKGLLNGGGHKEITFLHHEELRVFKFSLSGTREAIKGSFFGHPVLNSLDIKAFSVVDSRVVLNNSCDFATVLLEELGGPVADSAEALDNKSLAFDTLSAIDLIAEVLISEHLTNAVVDTETSGLSTAIDTTLLDVLASAAAFSVNVLLALDVHVGILNPGHNLFVGAHIGTEAINSSSNKALLDELHSVLAGNALELSFGESARVNLDATLATTEGNIGNSEFEGHQTGKSLNFLQIDVVGVTSTTLAGKLVS